MGSSVLTGRWCYKFLGGGAADTNTTDQRTSGRLGCVRVLSDPDRRNVLDPGHLDGGDVATCPGLLKVNAKCVRVLSDSDRRNVLDPGNLDGGDAATCPGIFSGTVWDHKGKTDIAQIIVSRSENRINQINFIFVEDGGNKLVMSEKIGGNAVNCVSLNTITLDYPHEVITGVKGKYATVPHGCGSRRLIRCITFVTNKGLYGPLEVSSTNYGKDIEFEYYVGTKQFGGFFGTFTSDGVETIGIYLKPLEKLTIHPVKKE
ncbi:hypothetical protein AgCh_029296 [Apium graveolens]